MGRRGPLIVADERKGLDMKNLPTKLLAALAVVVTLAACGGGGGGSKASLKQSDIVGLWDTSEVENNVKDEAYIYIDENGVIHPFDYVGDAFDRGPNCYFTDPGIPKDQLIIDSSGAATWLTVVSLSPIQYAEIKVTVEVLNGGNSLHIISPDYWDWDEDGNLAENNDETYPRITNLVTDDLQPICTEDDISQIGRL